MLDFRSSQQIWEMECLWQGRKSLGDFEVLCPVHRNPSPSPARQVLGHHDREWKTILLSASYRRRCQSCVEDERLWLLLDEDASEEGWIVERDSDGQWDCLPHAHRRGVLRHQP